MHRSISVAGIEICFHGSCEDARLLDERYGPFLIDSIHCGAACIELSLRDVDQASGTNAELVVTTAGDEFTLESLDLHAKVAVDGTTAKLRAPRLERYVDAVLRYVLSRQLLNRGGLLLHASALVRGERAWIFAGASGVGKTTISQNLPGRVLGDEAVAVIWENDHLVCHATPYWRAVPNSAPVAGLLFPNQGQENRLTALSPARGLGKLMSCVGPLLPGAQEQVMVIAKTVVSTGTALIFDVTLDSITAIKKWLDPTIAGLPAP